MLGESGLKLYLDNYYVKQLAGIASRSKGLFYLI